MLRRKQNAFTTDRYNNKWKTITLTSIYTWEKRLQTENKIERGMRIRRETLVNTTKDEGYAIYQEEIIQSVHAAHAVNVNQTAHNCRRYLQGNG